MNLAGIVAELKKERERLDRSIAALGGGAPRNYSPLGFRERNIRPIDRRYGDLELKFVGKRVKPELPRWILN